MKLVIAFLVWGMVGSSVGAVDLSTDSTSVTHVRVTPDHRYPWYKERFAYMWYTDTVFSTESEFFWPEGYHRPDSSSLSGYQLWMSYLPLWHSQRGVGSMYHGFIYTPDKVSRPIHFTRLNTQGSDKTFALELMAQYMKYLGREFDFMIKPYTGDTLRYADFLSGAVAYGSRMEVKYIPGEKRPPSDDEYAMFVELCDRQSSYRSLSENCVTVSKDSVRPGDMYITFDENGAKGKIIFFLTMIVDSLGHRLFTTGAGCADECDLHIPLVNNDKNYPWVTVDQIPALYPPMAHSGFFRHRLPGPTK
jgi:hypothetical protein